MTTQDEMEPLWIMPEDDDTEEDWVWSENGLFTKATISMCVEGLLTFPRTAEIDEDESLIETRAFELAEADLAVLAAMRSPNAPKISDWTMTWTIVNAGQRFGDDIQVSYTMVASYEVLGETQS